MVGKETFPKKVDKYLESDSSEEEKDTNSPQTKGNAMQNLQSQFKKYIRNSYREMLMKMTKEDEEAVQAIQEKFTRSMDSVVVLIQNDISSLLESLNTAKDELEKSQVQLLQFKEGVADQLQAFVEESLAKYKGLVIDQNEKQLEGLEKNADKLWSALTTEQRKQRIKELQNSILMELHNLD